MSASKGYEVCDRTADPDRWVRFERATTPQCAARMFLAAEEYDERQYDRPFDLFVRVDENGELNSVSVRVIPMHFEVT
jgi:hypothetical protein